MDFVGLDKLSLLDYQDKIACVLFSKNCNFRCPFCHNGMTVLESHDFIPFDEIMNYLKTRKGVLDGVVISGGEPTLMPDLKDKIKVIKTLGYCIKLDTNGTNPEIVLELINEHLIDYVAMDIKNAPNKYDITTSIHNLKIDNIKKTINVLMNSNIEYEFRTTLVKEFHTKDDMDALGKLIQGSKKLFLQKFVERDGCIKKGLHDIDKIEALEFKQILLKYVKEVELRGY